ncbi:hypothetical protein [Leifsonia kafniensis]|uniref:hypothetical protein n=1 Tax=Leifsonia kafniensis TaxID=475957 RepID=UPI0031EC9B93
MIHTPVIQTPLPELSDERVYELLHGRIAQILGADGEWTLVPRSSADTDAIFHGLKAEEIAATLATILRVNTAELRGEVAAQPTSLPWSPAPITVWADAPSTPVDVASMDAASVSEASAALVSVARTSVAA